MCVCVLGEVGGARMYVCMHASVRACVGGWVCVSEIPVLRLDSFFLAVVILFAPSVYKICYIVHKTEARQTA